MKKVIVFALLFFSFMGSLNAFCDYSRQKEYNVLAGYVSYKVEHNESNNTFRIKVFNLADPLVVEYNGTKYSKTDGESYISGLSEGTQVTLSVQTTDSECVEKKLRSLYVSIPYVNTYYNSNECKGHEDLLVCTSKFLDYKITRASFISMLENSSINNSGKKVESEKEVEPSTLETIISTISEYIVPVILVVLSSLISTLIFLPIYRKVKYGM